MHALLSFDKLHQLTVCGSLFYVNFFEGATWVEFIDVEAMHFVFYRQN